MWRRIGCTDRILIIKKTPLEQILSGDKTLEIRGGPCKSLVGSTIYLSMSGTSKVYGKATVVGWRGPLSTIEWEELHGAHLVNGDRLYGQKTYAWQLANVTRTRPTRIGRKRGAIGLQIGPFRSGRMRERAAMDE